MRVLRIELRRSVAAGMALVLIALSIAGFLWGGIGSSYSGSWATMTYALRSSLGLLWPLALGAGAWQARRERMAGLQELITTSPRSSAQRLAPVAAALAIGVVSAYLLVLLAGTVQVWRSPADGYLTLTGAVSVVVGALSLVAAVWLGLSLGRLMPSAFTAPLVTVLGVAFIALAGELDTRITGPDFSLLKPDLPIPSDDHFELPLDLSGEQALWLVGLAVTAFALSAALTRRGRLLALLPAVAATTVTLLLLPSSANASLYRSALEETLSVYHRDPDAMAPVCTPDLPKVCVMRVHSGLLPEVTGPARAAIKAMATLPAAPTSAIEIPDSELDTLGTTLDHKTLAMTLYLDDGGHVDELETLTGAMLNAAGSPSCPPVTPESESSGEAVSRIGLQNDAAREIVGTWLAQQVGARGAEPIWPEFYNPGWKAFTALPGATQRQRVVDFRRTVLRCDADADLLAALTGVAL